MRATKKFITSVYRGLPSLSVSITLYLRFPCEIKKRDNNVDQRLGCISVNPSISSSRFLIFPGDKSCLPTAVTNLLLKDWGQNAICSTTSLGNGGAPGQLEARAAPKPKDMDEIRCCEQSTHLASDTGNTQMIHRETLRQQLVNSSGKKIIYVQAMEMLMQNCQVTQQCSHWGSN